MNGRLLSAAPSLVVLTSISVASVALAQPGRGGTAKVWEFLAEKYDKNEDGKIAKDEYERGAETFARLDRNRDGILTREDWTSTRRTGGRPDRRSGGRLRGVAPRVGEQAPDFQLSYVKEPAKRVRLASFVGKKPVALIFGSCT